MASGLKALTLDVDEQVEMLRATRTELSVIMRLVVDQHYDVISGLMLGSKSFITPRVGMYELALATGAFDYRDKHEDHSYNASNAIAEIEELLEELKVKRDIEHGVVIIDVDGPHTEFMMDPEDGEVDNEMDHEMIDYRG